MIKDKLENATIYYNLSENIQKGLTWLKDADFNNISDGKYNIDEDKVFASVQTYKTKDDAKYEAHRKYIDIQYMIKGVEKVGVTNLKNCTTCVPYDLEKDLEFFDINVEEEFFELAEESFLIFYPHDAHKPSIKHIQKDLVKKVVVKIAI